MGVPFTIQKYDNERLESFKKPINAQTKIEVLRHALDLLEREIEKKAREKKWIKAARLCAPESRRVNRELRQHATFRLSNLLDD